MKFKKMGYICLTVILFLSYFAPIVHAQESSQATKQTKLQEEKFIIDLKTSKKKIN